MYKNDFAKKESIKGLRQAAAWNDQKLEGIIFHKKT
jgi:hypothetical protein